VLHSLARRTQEFMSKVLSLFSRIRQCRICDTHLPFPPNPLFRAHQKSRLLIVGQAPGIRAHQTGIPWNDPSGDRLRDWLKLDKKNFYNEKKIAIIPMGFCYPGTGPSGDLPPRKECATLWLGPLLNTMPHIQLTLLIGSYAQKHYLKEQCKRTLGATVASFTDYLPRYFPLPHPSPRNNRWLKQNPWFEQEVLPALQKACNALLNYTF
jgi:uracil-DNA glycosylase